MIHARHLHLQPVDHLHWPSFINNSMVTLASHLRCLESERGEEREKGRERGICTLSGGLMEHHGMAVVVEDGVQVQQPRKIEHQALLMARMIGRSHGEQGEGASVARSTALGFFWRIFARVAGYVTRVRRLFAFKLGKDGSVEVKEERRVSMSENTVEGGRVEACEPVLAEIIVTSPKETTIHGIHAVDTTVVEVNHEDCGRKCAMDNKDRDEEEAPLACNIVENTSATEQSTSDQQESVSATREPVSVILPELHGEDCTANEEQKHQSLEQDTSQKEERSDGLCTADGEEKRHSPEQSVPQDEKLADDVTSNKADELLPALTQLSADSSNTDNSQNGSSDVEPQELTSSRALKKTFSIKELNSVVAEQLTKCLNALERNMVPGKAEHRRAIVLATLVAIAVWARNAKHLHESMPRIRGAAINVHLRSRL